MNIMHRKKIFFLTSTLFFLLFPNLASFAESEAKIVVQYRNDLMYNIQKSLRSMNGILNGKLNHQDHLPNLALIMNISAKQSVDSFKIDTSILSESGKSKKEIWEDSDGFSSEMQALIRESAILQKLAQSGDLQALKAQLGVVSKTCSSCHKKFKNK